jgi:hypothetical protein
MPGRTQAPSNRSPMNRASGMRVSCVPALGDDDVVSQDFMIPVRLHVTRAVSALRKLVHALLLPTSASGAQCGRPAEGGGGRAHLRS